MTQYFTDFNVPKNVPIGITSILSNITSKPHSHKGGWTKVLRCQLINEGYTDVKVLGKDDLVQDYNVIIYDLGAEFKGVINIFGGLGPQYFSRIQELLAIRGKTYSWQHKVPDLSELIKSRLGKKSTDPVFESLNEEQLNWLKTISAGSTTFDQVAKKEHILIGDSHAPAMWVPNLIVDRRDGRTLSGALANRTIAKKFEGFSSITFHISSIDIRHHAMRVEKPQEYMVGLVLELEKQLLETGVRNVTLCHTVGIEDDSRKLPKTGYFKGTAFKGTWA